MRIIVETECISFSIASRSLKELKYCFRLTKSPTLLIFQRYEPWFDGFQNRELLCSYRSSESLLIAQSPGGYGSFSNTRTSEGAKSAVVIERRREVGLQRRQMSRRTMPKSTKRWATGDISLRTALARI